MVDPVASTSVLLIERFTEVGMIAVVDSFGAGGIFRMFSTNLILNTHCDHDKGISFENF